MNKNETITKKYLEKNFATKEYLEKNFVTKEYLDMKLENFVTKDSLEIILDRRFGAFKIDIIKDFRAINHQMVNEIMENAKTYFSDESDKRMTALKQGFNDDLKGYRDGVATIQKKVDNHEERISGLELKIA